MGIGYWIIEGDKTSCGGTVLQGYPKKRIGKNYKPVAIVGSPVSCGKHPGIYAIVGPYLGNIIDGHYAASTLYSRSTCPCNAFFIASQTWMSHGPYRGPSSYPAYLTGETADPGFVADYPVLRNTRDFPDENLRAMLRSNSHEVLLLTLREAFEVLDGWEVWRRGWTEVSESVTGQLMVKYGTNIKEVITTALIINQLGSFGIRAQSYYSHTGTELIKISGYPGIRKILNAPVFAAKNPKVVSLGIGKYGLKHAIIQGAKITFYFAAAVEVVNFILNDETSLARFMGSLATDVAKIGISSVISWGVGVLVVSHTSFVIAPLVIVVAVGFLSAVVLNNLDDVFGFNNKISTYLESAQQEFMQKACELADGIWDLGEMCADHKLDKGGEFTESEVKKYRRTSLQEITPREF